MVSKAIRGLFLITTFTVTTNALAVTSVFWSKADFLTAVSGMDIKNENFESYSAGTVIPVDTLFGNFSLAYATGGADVVIGNLYDTTSPSNYLGTTDADAFYSGDSITFNFTSPVQGFGLYIITGFEVEIFDNDFTLTTSSGLESPGNSAIPDAGVSLSDGNAYFLGIMETNPSMSFSSVSLSSVPAGYYYNVDDITTVVPELETYAMMIGGLPLMLWWQRRRASENRLLRK